MTAGARLTPIIVVIVALLAGACAPRGSSGDPGGTQPGSPAAKKRIVAATNGNLVTLTGLFSTGVGMSIQGLVEFGRLVHGGMTTQGLSQALEPQLAESVPGVENGLWTVLPDGRMATTWKIRSTARWHDGVPVTADDLLFTVKLGQDPELDFVRDPKFKLIDSIEAPDQRTVVVRWKQTYIEADQLFGLGGSEPLPRHLLEEPYTADKGSFLGLPFWTSQFVGSGPFKITRWDDGVGAILAASDGYALGRPRIDEIEVKFIPASATLVANALSGAVELTLGRGLSAEQASAVRDQWREGVAAVIPTSPNGIIPQHLNPSPAVVGNVQFRRALVHALDRDELASGLTAGMGMIAHSGLPIEQAVYREVERGAAKYEYDPRRAMQIVEALGYTRGADGTFQDAAGQRLTVEIRSDDKDVNVRTVLAVADYWKKAGVHTEPLIYPTSRRTDFEYIALFPAFDTGGTYATLKSLTDIRKSEMRLPENGYQKRNKGNYVHPELESMIDRYYLTIPMTERLGVLEQVFKHLTDQVVAMYLYYDVNPVLVGNRLGNVAPGYFGNSHEWEVKS
jgi:ABC-type transport system substrate-binding protein